MEYLAHGHSQECHRDSVIARYDVPLSGLKVLADEVRRKYQECSDSSLINDIHVHTAGENAFARAPRLLLHGIAFTLFHSERESRKRIGDQVDPQQVGRLEDREVQYRSYEYRQHLADICREEELY